MSKEKLKGKRGITLIALVITIIVMLILVVATVTVALNGGLFKSAKKATQDTEVAREAESELSSGRVQINNVWYDSIEDYIAGIESKDQLKEVTGEKAWVEHKDDKGDITITRGNQTLNIGDFVNYTTNKSSSTKWRVLGVEKGRLLLMADSNVLDENGSELKVELSGTNWGEDGQPLVKQLNEACQQYLNGDYAESIRSIKVEDINNITGYNPLYTGKRNPTQEDIENDIEHTHRYDSGQVDEYGNKVKYTWSTDTDKKVVYDDTGEGGNGKHQNVKSSASRFAMPPDGQKLGEEGLTLESTYYYYYPYTLSTNNSTSGSVVGIETTSPAYKMIFKNSSGTTTSYYLASTCVHADKGQASWGMFEVTVIRGSVGGGSVWDYGSGPQPQHLGIRPVVSLKSDVKLTKDDNTPEQNESVTYNIGG